jgi:hypothetical protein
MKPASTVESLRDRRNGGGLVVCNNKQQLRMIARSHSGCLLLGCSRQEDPVTCMVGICSSCPGLAAMNVTRLFAYEVQSVFALAAAGLPLLNFVVSATVLAACALVFFNLQQTEQLSMLPQRRRACVLVWRCLGAHPPTVTFRYE